jgi:hypothetical protein
LPDLPTLNYRAGRDRLGDDVQAAGRKLRRWTADGVIWTFLLASWGLCMLAVLIVLIHVFVS